MSARILIVEDDQPVRSSISGYLTDQGYEALESPDAPQALRWLKQMAPDLMVLDLRLPGMDGIELLREVRRHWVDLPVTIVSGAGDMTDVVEALRLGACDYLFKPIADMSALGQVVRKGLESARSSRKWQRDRMNLEERFDLRSSELELAQDALTRKTVALEEVLKTCRDLGDRRVGAVVTRIEEFCKPVLTELRSALQPDHHQLVERISTAITDALAEPVDRLAAQLSVLSPAELRICEMVRRGLGSKEIAAAMALSVDTVETHRRNIRRKLKLTNESVNLSTYLQSLAAQNSGGLGDRPAA